MITGVTDMAGRELRQVAIVPGYGEYTIDGDVLTFGPGVAATGVRVAYLTPGETGGNRKARRRRLALMRV